jgi:hypothetical protein
LHFCNAILHKILFEMYMTAFWLTLGFTIGIFGLTFAQNKKIPQVNIVMTISSPIDTAFGYIVPVKLSRIFKKYKRFPAITKTNETELWNKAGLTRTVYFEDGITANESLITVETNKSFSYKIEKFTSSLRKLAKRIEGEWLFTDLSNGQTKIEWTYKIIPKNGFTRILIKWFVLKDLKVLLNNALTILKEDLENGEYKNADR